jgi:hypothetical protein
MDVPDGAVRLHPQLARNVVKTVDEAIAPKIAELTKVLSCLPTIAHGTQSLLSANQYRQLLGNGGVICSVRK